MRNVAPRKSSLPKRGAARWTPLELALVVTSVLLIIFPLYAEAYRWISPTQVPAAQLETATPSDDESGNKAAVPQATRETFTPDPLTPTLGGVTDTPTVAVDTPTTAADTPTTAADTPTTAADTPTTAADTPTTAADTPTTAADTPTTAADTPTAEPTINVPPTITPTPLIGEAPLTIDKVASVASASVNSEYSYSLSVFSDSSSAINAQVTDNLDSQTTYVSASASNGSCSNSGSTVTCNISVQNNKPAAITIRVRVSASAQNGGRIRNQASVRDANNNSASSEPVFVEVSGVAPTSGPTSTPNPNQPAATATPLITAEATSEPVQPTTPPEGTSPTNTPVPSSGGGGSSGGGSSGGSSSGSKSQATAPVPTAPAPVLLPPTPAVGAAIQPATPTPTRLARPQPTATRPRATATTVRQNVQVPATQAPATQATQAPTATSTPSVPTQIALDPGIFFRMASDWGSVYPGNQVYYVIVFKNNRGADGAALNQVRISSTLPSNLEVISAKADRGDLKQDQNNLSLQVDTLKPGEGIEIGVQTRVKQGVAAGTRIISQASAFYDGLALPVYSNIVTVQVVDAATAANQPAQPAGTSIATAVVTSTTVTTSTAVTTNTVAPTATTGLTTNAANPTATMEATATMTSTAAATSSPTATVAPTATQIVAGGTSGSGSLPDTSTGVPLLGFALMGMTMMIRAMRLHRAQTRV